MSSRPYFIASQLKDRKKVKDVEKKLQESQNLKVEKKGEACHVECQPTPMVWPRPLPSLWARVAQNAAWNLHKS